MNIDFHTHSRWDYHIFDNQNVTEEIITNFSRLNTGWRYGEGIRPSDDIILNAVNLNKYANSMGFYITNATPLVDGGIELIIFYQTYELEFIFEPNNSITYYKTNNNVDIEDSENLSFDEAKNKINQFWDEVCEQSGYSNSTNIYRTRKDSVATPSVIRATGPEFLLSA